MRKKWLVTVLSVVLLLPVILVATVLLLLGTTDLNQHRETIAAHISELTGRRLSLGGDLDLKLASTTSLTVSDIALANAAWGSDEDMVVIRRLETEIELLPLLRGKIHIPRFHVDGVKALLETDASGAGNWVLVEPVDDTPAVDDADPTSPFRLPWIGDLLIGNVELAYRDAQTGRETTAKLDHARIKADQPMSPTTIDVVGQVNGNPVEINGKVALPSLFKVENLDLPIELHASVMGLEADASGSISGSAYAPAIDFSLKAEADSLKQMRVVFGDAVPEVKSVKLKMDVRGDQGQPVSFKFNATAGEARLEAALNLQRQGPRPNLTGTVAITDVDVLRLWAPLFADQSGGAAAQQMRSPASAAPPQLDQPLELAWLGSLDADILLSVKRINLPQTRLKTLQSRFVVDDRWLNIEGLEMVTDAGSITTTVSFDARNKEAAAQLDLKTSTIALGKLRALAENKRFVHSLAEVEMSLTAHGETAAGLIESLQGNAQLDYNDKQRKEKLSVNLTRKPDQTAAEKIRLNVTAVGYLDEQPVELRGHVSPPANMVSSSQPYDIDFSLQAFGVSGKVTGIAAAPYSLDGLDLAVEAKADNLDGLRKAFGQELPRIGKTDVRARLNSGQSKLRLADLRVGLADGYTEGWLVLDTSSAIPGVEAELKFTDLNLEKLLPAQQQQAQTKPETTAKSKTDKVFSDEPLPFEVLSRANLKATLRAKNLVGRHKRRLKKAEVRVTMVGGKLSASLLEFASNKGELVADFIVDASGKGAPDITIKIEAPHVELGEIMVADDGTTAVEGPLAVDIFLEGRGRSVAQIMATLNGNVNLLMKQGSADARGLDLFVGGLGAMFGTIFIDQSSKTKIECAISDLDFDQGILTPRLAVLDTQYSTVIAEGRVDLKQEQLDLKVSPNAKGVTLSVAFPVLLKGALSKPDIEVEKTGALLKAGELWATVVYPPTALLKFSDLGDGKSNPCVSMVAEKAGIPILEDVGKAVKGTVKGVGGVVKGVGSGLDKFIDAVKQEGDTDTETADVTGKDAEVDVEKSTSDELDDPDLFMDY